MTTDRREELLENLSPVLRLLVWDKETSTREFAEKNVYLPKSNPVNAGLLVTFDLSPHLIAIMEAFDDIAVEEIWLMFGSQMSKTLFLFICWAKNARMNPKTMVWMISKDVAIPRYQEEKISALVEASESLKEIISQGLVEKKKNKSKTGIFHHQGTSTYLIGSRNDDDKKSITCKIAIVDEADEMDGIQAIEPLLERTKTFEGRGGKAIIASTKKHKNGAITQGVNSCEQKRYLGLICPHCEKLIEMNFKQLIIELPHEHKERKKITDEDFDETYINEVYIPESSSAAHYECNECQKKITTGQRNRQINKFKIGWIKKGVLEKPKSIAFMGGSVNSFFVSFESMARKYLKALTEKEDIKRAERLQVFYEGYVNEYFDPRSKEVSKSDDILLLGSGLKRRELPDDVVSIYMTIDSQKGHKQKENDHYWYVVRAWDDKMNSYKLESGKIYHDKDLYNKIFTQYNIGERVIGIRRVVWDVQGHGEIETLAFIHQINSRIGAIYNDKDDLRNYVVYPYRGESEIKGKTYRLQEEEKKTDDLMDTKYPIVIGNSKRGKDALSNAMSKTVKYRKGDEVQSPDRNMWYIDEDEVEAGIKRRNRLKEEKVKIPNESYEKQLTSEIFGLMPKSKSKEGWHPFYDGRDNHFWDCEYMQFICVEFDNLQERILSR